jgi:hypothetical protein
VGQTARHLAPGHRTLRRHHLADIVKDHQPAALRAGQFPDPLPPGERLRLGLKGLRAKLYEAARTPLRPRLSGNNIGVWRSDYEQINGFDEQFVGWGLEDRDLQVRLERLGLRAWSILLRTAPVHLWHPAAPSFARNNEGTANLAYFQSLADRPTFCDDGLVKPAARPTVERTPAEKARIAISAAKHLDECDDIRRKLDTSLAAGSWDEATHKELIGLLMGRAEILDVQVGE